MDLQIQNSLPGLHQELEKHIFKITDQDIRSISKNVWQRKTKTYINEKNRQDPLEDIKGYKKLDFEKLSKESFERKPYFYSMNLESVRMKFKISSHMVQTVRKICKGKYKLHSPRCPSCKDFPTSYDKKISTQEEENLLEGSFCQQKVNDDANHSSQLEDYLIAS